MVRCTCAGTAAHFSALTSGVRRRRVRTFPKVIPQRAGRGGVSANPAPQNWLGALGPGRSHLPAAAANWSLAW